MRAGARPSCSSSAARRRRSRRSGLAFEQGVEERVLVGEVAVERRLAGPRLARDVLHGGAADPDRHEAARRGGEQVLAAVASRAGRRAAGARSRGTRRCADGSTSYGTSTVRPRPDDGAATGAGTTTLHNTRAAHRSRRVDAADAASPPRLRTTSILRAPAPRTPSESPVSVAPFPASCPVTGTRSQLQGSRGRRVLLARRGGPARGARALQRLPGPRPVPRVRGGQPRAVRRSGVARASRNAPPDAGPSAVRRLIGPAVRRLIDPRGTPPSIGRCHHPLARTRVRREHVFDPAADAARPAGGWRAPRRRPSSDSSSSARRCSTPPSSSSTSRRRGCRPAATASPRSVRSRSAVARCSASCGPSCIRVARSRRRSRRSPGSPTRWCGTRRRSRAVVPILREFLGDGGVRGAQRPASTCRSCGPPGRRPAPATSTPWSSTRPASAAACCATRCATPVSRRSPATSRARTLPEHRALTDARATVDVLHGLIERAGTLGAVTLEDLRDLSRSTSDQAFRRIDLVREAPATCGVYRFLDARDEVLYVGKATDLRSRLRTYFGQDRAPPGRRPRPRDGTRELDTHRDPARGRGPRGPRDPRPPAALQPALEAARGGGARRPDPRAVPTPVGGPRARVPATRARSDRSARGPARSNCVEALHEGFPLRTCTSRLRRRAGPSRLRAQGPRSLRGAVRRQPVPRRLRGGRRGGRTRPGTTRPTCWVACANGCSRSGAKAVSNVPARCAHDCTPPPGPCMRPAPATPSPPSTNCASAATERAGARSSSSAAVDSPAARGCRGRCTDERRRALARRGRPRRLRRATGS